MADLITNFVGVTAGAASVIYAGKMVLEGRKDKKAEKAAEAQTPSNAVTDAAAANSILMAALKEEREEVQRLSVEVEALRKSNSELYEQLTAQRRAYEKEIQDLRKELLDLTDRLDDLRTRIRYGAVPDQKPEQ